VPFTSSARHPVRAFDNSMHIYTRTLQQQPNTAHLCIPVMDVAKRQYQDAHRLIPSPSIEVEVDMVTEVYGHWSPNFCTVHLNSCHWDSCWLFRFQYLSLLSLSPNGPACVGNSAGSGASQIPPKQPHFTIVYCTRAGTLPSRAFHYNKWHPGAWLAPFLA